MKYKLYCSQFYSAFHQWFHSIFYHKIRTHFISDYITALIIFDPKIKLEVLIDTSADVSVLPRRHNENIPTDTTRYQLFAANGYVIETFGYSTISIS